MTISVVQTATNTSNSSTSSFGAGVTAGNWLLLMGGLFQFTTPPTAAPNNPKLGSNVISPTTLASVIGANNGDTAVIAWLYKIQAGDAGATAVTYSVNGQSGLLAPVALELSAGGALSADLAATGHGNTGGATSFSLSAGSTAAANELAATYSAFFSNNGTMSDPSWTILDSVHSVLAGDKAVAGAGTAVSIAGNAASSFANYTLLVVTLQESGGTSHTATASLTVTPSLSASRTRGAYRTGSLAVSPSLSAGRARGKYRTASLSVAPVLSATRRAAHVRTAALSVIPRLVALATGGQAKLERQLVRLAVAAYFGGTEVTADAGTCFQGGPLASFGLGTAYPYSVRHVPDEYYTAGGAPGRNWGVVMSTTKVRRTNVRDSYGGGTSGWRARTYQVECQLELICELPHIEEAGAGLDDLIDQFYALIAADRNLGTKAAYQAGTSPLLIIQAGEGRAGVTDETDRFEEIDDKKGRYRGTATVAFDALVMVQG